MNTHATETIDADTFEQVGKAATAVVAKAGQSMLARQEQSNALAEATPMAMLDRALANGASTETLEKLLALQERWEKNQGRKAFDEAMAAAKAEIPTIRKNRTVDFTSSKGRTHYRHEDLAEIASTINPILGKFGLSYRFRTTSAIGEPISVTCIISHRLGYSEENTLVGPRDDSGNKNSLQQVGSTLTYLQRMTLKAALGLAAAEDDDGKASGSSDEADDKINPAQLKRLQTLIDETGSDTAKFCEIGKIDSLADMRASDFDSAVRLLDQKKAKQAEKGQAA